MMVSALLSIPPYCLATTETPFAKTFRGTNDNGAAMARLHDLDHLNISSLFFRPSIATHILQSLFVSEMFGEFI